MTLDQTPAASAASHQTDDALRGLIDRIPYVKFMGIEFERHGDEITSVMPFAEMLIGNPFLPALHGGATASFLEVAAVTELMWFLLSAEPTAPAGDTAQFPAIPKTIDITVDYLRPGLPQDAFARARIVRSGRRYATVHVEGWQASRTKLFVQATAHFLMPDRDG